MSVKNLRDKRGFPLIELLLVLGSVSALIASAFIVFPKVQASQRAETELKNIATIQAGIKSLYASTATYTGLSNSNAYKAGIFPAKMYKQSGFTFSIVNSWGGVCFCGICCYRSLGCG